MAVRMLPSTEALVASYLRSSADVTALIGTRIGTELYAGTGAAVWLSLVTGSEQFRNHLISAVIDVRSYGGSKADADLLARTVHAVIHDMPGAHATGVVTGVETLTIPAWLPDEGFEPARPRYLASYSVTAHPLPS